MTKLKIIKEQSNDALEILRGKFNTWRKNRSNHRERIPERLLKQAAKLCNFYNKTLIMKTLRIDHAKLTEYIQKQAARKSSKSKANMDFALIPVKQPASAFNPCCEIDIENQTGLRIKVRLADIPTEQMLNNLKTLY